MKKTISLSNSLRAGIVPALVLGMIAIGNSTARATVLLGNPYTPTGATYTVSAVQGINSTNGSGGTKAGAQVNRDFEFQGTLGVSYTDPNGGGGKKGGAGGLTDFGIGIYSSGGLTLSTGLEVQLNSPSAASSVTVTLADFDIHAGDAFFNPRKVESSVLVYGADHTSVLFSASPADVFKALVNTSGPNGSEDYWNLNFGTLLSNAGQSSSTPIGGFLLYADSNNGEKVPSDPYFITSINGGVPITPVPEPSTYVGGITLVALLIGTHAKAVLKRKKLAA